ncbi:MAG: nitrilase-related carbon-nitrogen hydrolase [Pseudomonadota bacterium]|nr:nitrilase-related carbon-nitrogen hydrolase [Pseudomonadota bacterium]
MFQITGIQINPVLADVQANLKRGIHFMRQVADESNLIVFPELWTTGYYLSKDVFMDLAETRDGPTITQLRDEARKANSVIISSFAEKDEAGKIYISAAIIDHTGELLSVVRKSLLWGRENEIFSKGKIEYPIVETKFAKIGVLICYEMEFPEPSRLLALAGAEIIVCPSVWSVAASRRWDIQLPARALDNSIFIFGINTVGNNTCGKSKLVGPMGDILAEASDSREEILSRVVDIKSLYWARDEIHYLEHFHDKLTPGSQTIPIPSYSSE